ncbi:MAG TPA: EpsI family protein [Planctomycetota bacterium]|nr:EpsI family protein [Planctomycetota bacterium]
MLKVSSAVLWLLAPGLLFLSWYRPFTVSVGRAERLPAEIGRFTLVEETPLTPREHMLLGTDDAVSRTYRAADGGLVFLVAVFHQHNWKSVHPPHLCLRGSDMLIEADGTSEPLALPGGGSLIAGRVTTRSRADHRGYLSLFAYGARGLRTGSYSEFVWYHLPRAVLRRSVPGYLVRVEAWLDDGAAEARCREFLADVVPALEALLQ